MKCRGGTKKDMPELGDWGQIKGGPTRIATLILHCCQAGKFGISTLIRCENHCTTNRKSRTVSGRIRGERHAGQAIALLNFSLSW